MPKARAITDMLVSMFSRLPGLPALGASGMSSSMVVLAYVAAPPGIFGIAGYELDRSLDGQTWTNLYTGAFAGLPPSEIGLPAATTFFYRLRSFDGAPAPNYSQYVSASATTLAGSSTLSTAIERGLLSIRTGLGGTGRLIVNFPRPTTNSDGTPLHDLKTTKIYVGTQPGTADIVNGLDVSTTQMGIAFRFRVTELIAPLRYYAWMTAIDAVGNESALSATYTALAAVYVAPVRSFLTIPVNKILNLAGDYRIPASGATGGYVIAANDVYLTGFEDDGVTKRVLTHSGATHGITVNAGVSRFWIDGIQWSRPSGSGQHVFFNGTPGVDGLVSNHAGMTVPSGSACFKGNNDPVNLNGTEFYSIEGTVTASLRDETQAIWSNLSNFIVRDADCLNINGDRSGMYGNCHSFEAFNFRWVCAGATLQGFMCSAFGTASFFLHDFDCTIGGAADTLRVLNMDGPNINPGAGAIVHKILWGRFTFAAGQSSNGSIIRCRNYIGPNDVGFTTFDMLNSGASYAIPFSWGSADSTGEVDNPYGGNVYNCRGLNIGVGQRLFGAYGESNWSGTLNMWNCDLGGIVDSGGGGASGNLTCNFCTFPYGVQKVGLSAWRAYQTTVGTGPNPFSNGAAWQDYNPALDTPSPPGTPVAVNSRVP